MFWPSVKILSSSTVHNNTVTLNNHKCLHVWWFHIKCSVVTVVNKLQMSLWELCTFYKISVIITSIYTHLSDKDLSKSLFQTSTNLFSMYLWKFRHIYKLNSQQKQKWSIWGLQINLYLYKSSQICFSYF